MKIAAIQPYFFPYIGYLELLASADLVCLLDDVQFKRRSWINRNRIRSDRPANSWSYLTIPVQHAHRSAKIDQIEMQFSDGWSEKLQRRISLLYGENAVQHPLVQHLLALPGSGRKSLSEALVRLLRLTMSELGITSRIVMSSSIDIPANVTAESRIISLVKTLNGTEYLNLPGGIDLYSSRTFLREGIALTILPMTTFLSRHTAIQNLSVLDGILSGVGEDIATHLSQFKPVVAGNSGTIC